MTNVARHAGPTAAEVVIEYRQHEVSVAVRDSGVGHQGAPGRGLRGLRERVEMLDGTFVAADRSRGGYEVARDHPPHRNRPMISVALADDDELVRMGLRVLVTREADLELVGEAVDGDGALALVRSARPDVLLLDLKMPGLDGLGVLRAIAADPAPAHTRVIVVTTFEIDRYVVEALQARGERVPAQEQRAGRARPRHPRGRGRGRAALAVGDPPRGRDVRPAPRRVDPAAGRVGLAHRPRARDGRVGRDRAVRTTRSRASSC